MEMQLTPVAHDKHSGYTLVKDSELAKVLELIVDCDRYKTIDNGQLVARRKQATEKLNILARKIAKDTGKRSLCSRLQRSTHEKDAGDTAQMQLRCKSQKEAGKV